MAKVTTLKGGLDPQSDLSGNLAAPSPGLLDQTGSNAIAVPDSGVGAASVVSGLHWTWLYSQYATVSAGAAASDPATELAKPETAAPAAGVATDAATGIAPAFASASGGHANFDSAPAPNGRFTAPKP